MLTQRDTDLLEWGNSLWKLNGKRPFHVDDFLDLVERLDRCLKRAIEQRDKMALEAKYDNDYWIFANGELHKIMEFEK